MKLQTIASNRYRAVWRDARGAILLEEEVLNTVVEEGRNALCNEFLRFQGNVSAWYAGLKGVGQILDADSAASHPNWTEFQDYDETTRRALVFGAPASGVSTAVDVVYTFNATGTVGGAFMISESTKGGSSGLLYGAVDFPQARNVATGFTLTLTGIGRYLA